MCNALDDYSGDPGRLVMRLTTFMKEKSRPFPHDQLACTAWDIGPVEIQDIRDASVRLARIDLLAEGMLPLQCIWIVTFASTDGWSWVET